MKLKSLINDYSHGGMSDRNPFTDEQAQLFLAVCAMEMGELKPEAKDLVTKDPICRIAQGRMNFAKVKATVPTLLWISIICEGSPGNAVIWAYTLCDIAEKEGDEPINLTTLTKYFPNGYPTEDTKRKCWEGQKRTPDMGKGITDNKMDSPEYWELGAENENISPDELTSGKSL